MLQIDEFTVALDLQNKLWCNFIKKKNNNNIYAHFFDWALVSTTKQTKLCFLGGYGDDCFYFFSHVYFETL